jgi:hypothetical protein
MKAVDYCREELMRLNMGTQISADQLRQITNQAKRAMKTGNARATISRLLRELSYAERNKLVKGA